MNKIDKDLLAQVADLHSVPQGSYNIRKNGESVGRSSDTDIEIVSKTDKQGVDIYVRKNVKNKSVHLPVIVTQTGFEDLVYNDFYIESGADVVIVAGCGIHNSGDKTSTHNGIHTFHLAKNSKIKYVEKHLGLGEGKGGKVLNPVTNIIMKEGSVCEMETVQLGGVTYSKRNTKAKLGKDAKLVIKEKILTTDEQEAKTEFKVELVGKGSSVEVVSRSVAKGSSKQKFVSKIIGNAECFGHVECDGIVLDKAQIISVPEIEARDVDASLVHEAAIGKIAGEQLVKLMTLGLTKEEAEAKIIKGYLN